MSVEKQKIYVQTFQNFSIVYNQNRLDEDMMKSHQLLKLLAYIIINHKRKISFDELIELLWYFDDSENPNHALMNLVYRLRKLIKQKLQLKDFIVTEKGYYYFNNKIYELIIDADLFDHYGKHAHKDAKKYRQCLEYYQGRFLPMINDDVHFLSKQNYYHTVYIHIVCDFARWLEKHKQYLEMETIAQKALMIDRYEEEFHYIYMKSLYLLNKNHEAIEEYKNTTDLFYRSLGVDLSEKMHKLYLKIKEETYQRDMSITDIQNELRRDSKQKAYFCDYETFRNLYLTQARLIDRLGITSQICLITLLRTHEDEKTLNHKITKQMQTIMKHIHSSLEKGLRYSDIVSRVSVNQFLVLLPICNFEDATLVIKRALNDEEFLLRKNKYLTLNYSIHEVQ